MANKEYEKKAFEFLQPKFHEVIWLSKTSAASIDFKCRIGEQWFKIEAKENTATKKARLLPSQVSVDAVVMLVEGQMTLVWKKDFGDYVTIDKVSLIKVPMSVKIRLDELKQHRRESYGEVVARVLSID